MQIMDTIGKAVIIFSLLGVGILYGLSLTSFVEPPYVPLEAVAVGTHEGAFIRTRGVITDFRVTEYGNVLTIGGNKAELPIFVESADEELLNLNYGDEIEVQGRVKLYKDRYELVTSGNAIKKLIYENESIVSFVSQIAMHPEEYEGRRISVVGYAEDVYKRVFYLGDEKEAKYLIRVKVETEARTEVNNGSIPVSEVQKGDKIIAEGVFVYNPENMRYELNLISLRRR